MKINYKMLIKIIFTLVIICSIFASTDKVYAEISLSNMEGQASNFIQAGKDNSGNIKIANITKDFVSLGQILTFVGAGVLVAVTTYMGIKYLTAGPEAQAKLKVQLIGVVVSGVVIFGAYGIWKTVVQIASQFD